MQHLTDKTFSCLILCMFIYPCISQANLGEFHNNTLNANQLINPFSLGCTASNDSETERVVNFYSNLYKAKNFTKNGSKYTIAGYSIRGISGISFTNRKNYSVTNVDLSIPKYGMHFLRISAFGENVQGDENFGYYFIIRGKVTDNEKNLNELGISSQNFDLEETKAGNTRLKCILVG